MLVLWLDLKKCPKIVFPFLNENPKSGNKITYNDNIFETQVSDSVNNDPFLTVILEMKQI